jgi:hypothetical protein
MASLGGMEQWGLDADRVMIYRCRAELSSAVVALTDKVGALIPPKDGFTEDGGSS